MRLLIVSRWRLRTNAGPAGGGTRSAPRRRFSLKRWLGLAGVLLLVAGGCGRFVEPHVTPTPRTATEVAFPVRLTPVPGLPGNPDIGRRLIVAKGCAGCHTVRGIPTATGVAGPNLTNVVLRPTLAGEQIPMTPETLTRFLLEPSAVKPLTPMPDVGLTIDEAQHLAAYLYSMPLNPAANR